jgi:hypothetical protein
MDQDSLAELAAGVRGAVFSPESEGYDDARLLWNGTVDKKPAVIVRCTGVADVIDAVNYTRRYDPQNLFRSRRGLVD